MTHILTHTENLQSHLAGALRSARWLYAFVLIPFYCFQQRKMRPFPCQRKLTHTGADCGADPHRDPHGETSERNTWIKEFLTSSFLGQKRPQTLMPQRMEGILSLGKDEVGGSNPPSSSKKHRKLRFSVLFCCKNALLGVGQNVRQLPDPHPDPHAGNIAKTCRATGRERCSPPSGSISSF